MQSCLSYRHVPKDEKLLSKTSIKLDNKDLDNDDIESTIKQQANSRMLGIFRFHLTLYNIIQPKRKHSNWRSKMAKVIGEPPVIYDSTLVAKTIKTMEYLLSYKGYYQATVTSSVKQHKRSVKVNYEINTGIPHTINKITYDILDPNIYNVVLNDTSNSLVKTGNNIDIDVLEEERTRLIRLMKNNGYYDFSINNVHYYADTNANNYKSSITLAIRKSFEEESIDDNTPFKQYRINNVYVYPFFNPKKNIELGSLYRDSILTEENIEGFYFKFLHEHRFKPIVFFQSNFIEPGSLYNIKDIEQTHQHIASLKQFRLINIVMKKDSIAKPNGDKELNCSIYLTPLTKQTYNIELEGTNTSGNFGGGAGVSFQNRNLFKGAENLSGKASLSLQTMRDTRYIDQNLLNTLETSAEIHLELPKLWPINLFKRNDDFIRNRSPKTRVSISTSFQKRPDFSRLLNNANLEFYWNSGKKSKLTHSFSPVEFYQVKVTDTIDGFSDNFNEYIKRSYEDQFISVVSYDLMYSSQDINKFRNFMFLSWNIEGAGNLLEGIYELSNAEPVDGSYRIFGLDFSQFVKTDIEIRYYQVFNKSNSLVYRTFFGIGVPYGNSKSSGLPFIKKYFTGGANDIRAYQVRMIGPGSYSNSSILNNVADMKLLANIEYRFDIIKYFEGALFLDAGNIWNINQKSEQPGADFSFDRFYKELAIGTGVGLRFDISFIIIRFDFGVPLYDPRLAPSKRWLASFHTFKPRDITFNFGIGYPF